MFQRCSIAKNAIRFSFSHSLTSLFCCTFFFFVPRNLRGSHFATLACLHSPCTYNLCLLHLYSYILSFHPFPSALPPPCFSSSIKLPFSLHPSHLCLSSFPSSASSPFLLSSPRLASLSLSLVSHRGCSVCRHGFCSTRVSGCFSTRRTRTASTNPEPSGASAHLPAKCKPPAQVIKSKEGVSGSSNQTGSLKLQAKCDYLWL